MMENLRIQRIDDPAQALAWRRQVMSNVFGCEPTDEMLEANLRYYQSHLPDRSHVAVEVLVDGEGAGCGGVCFESELPSPDNPTGLCAYIMNIYVCEPWRRRGVGHAIVGYLVEMARHRGCGKIYLETTKQAQIGRAHV